MVAFKIFVSGFVQGVGYRRFAQKQAEVFKLQGWTRNLTDGRVEIFAQGEFHDCEAYLQVLKRGPSHAEVKDLRFERSESLIESSTFSILPDEEVL